VFIDLTTPKPRGSSNLVIPEPVSIVDLSTPEPSRVAAPIVDLSTPELDQFGGLVVDLSTPEPELLVPDLSISARALAMARCRPSGLQLLTPDLRRYLLNRRPHPRRNLITVGMAYHYISDPKHPYRQKWYYLVMAGFARFLGLEVHSLRFRLYGRAIEPNETVINVCHIYSLCILALLITVYVAWFARG
jgi:hypothetical protein